MEAVAKAKPSSEEFCKACFTGEYPVPIDPNDKKRKADLDW